MIPTHIVSPPTINPHINEMPSSATLVDESDGRAFSEIPFGEYLFVVDLISEEQLLEALGDHWSNGGTIGAAICRQGFLPAEVVEEQAMIYHSLETVEV